MLPIQTPDNLFHDGVPGGELGTLLTAAWLNGMQGENLSILQAAGIAPGAAQNQILQALRSAGVFQTPPQFDISTKAATMAAVQRAIGSYSTVLPINASTTLTAASVGCLVSAYSAGGFVLTLPKGSTLPAGSAIAFFGSISSGNVAVITQGGETIATGTTQPTGITLYPGSNFVLTWSGLAWVVTGEAQMPFSPLFASNLVGGGPFYQKLPGGFVEIFGNGVVNGSGDLVVTFPFTLAAAPIVCFAMSGQNTDAPYATSAKSANSATFPFFKTNTGAKSTGGFNSDWRVIGRLP